MIHPGTSSAAPVSGATPGRTRRAPTMGEVLHRNQSHSTPRRNSSHGAGISPPSPGDRLFAGNFSSQGNHPSSGAPSSGSLQKTTADDRGEKASSHVARGLPAGRASSS